MDDHCLSDLMLSLCHLFDELDMIILDAYGMGCNFQKKRSHTNTCIYLCLFKFLSVSC